MRSLSARSTEVPCFLQLAARRNAGADHLATAITSSEGSATPDRADAFFGVPKTSIQW